MITVKKLRRGQKRVVEGIVPISVAVGNDISDSVKAFSSKCVRLLVRRYRVGVVIVLCESAHRHDTGDDTVWGEVE